MAHSAMRGALAGVVFLAFSASGIAQQPAPQYGPTGLLQASPERLEVENNRAGLAEGVCNAIVRKVLSASTDCVGGHFASDEAQVRVVQEPGGLVHLSVHIIGPSPALAGVASVGFEKHQFAVLLVYDRTGWPYLLVQNHEPLFNAGSFDNISLPENPNTRYIERRFEDHLLDLYTRVWNAVLDHFVEQSS